MPEIELALNVPRLLVGNMAPERIDLVRPKLQISRTESGEFAFLLGSPVQIIDSDIVKDDVDVVAALLKALRAPTGSSDVPMSSLKQLEVTGAGDHRRRPAVGRGLDDSQGPTSTSRAATTRSAAGYCWIFNSASGWRR